VTRKIVFYYGSENQSINKKLTNVCKCIMPAHFISPSS